MVVLIRRVVQVINTNLVLCPDAYWALFAGAQAPNPRPEHMGSTENATSSAGVPNLPSLENELEYASSSTGSTENNATSATCL